MTAPQPAIDAPVRRLLVVGAGAANLKSTVAVNLAAAACAAGLSVCLVDRDGASSAALRAVARSSPEPLDAPFDVPLPWAPTALRVLPPVVPVAAGGAARDTLLVVDPAPRFDAALRAELAAASDVLVPADASALARRVLREVVGALSELGEPDAARGGGPAPRVRVALARLLPRTTDRWALVEELDALAPGGLLSASVPMARRAARAGAPSPAVLYAPGTAAARAYAALGRELLGPTAEASAFAGGGGPSRRA